jgi:hypothetical protein
MLRDETKYSYITGFTLAKGKSESKNSDTERPERYKSKEDIAFSCIDS